MARAQGWLIFAGFGWRNLAGRSQSSRLILANAHFGLPPDWGGYAGPWIEAAARCYVGVEELRMKLVVVSDESLELLARSFPRFRALILISCEGFSTDGLAAIASH